MIPNIALLSISIVLACLDELVQISHGLGFAFTIVDTGSVAAVKVSKEDTWVAIESHENESVGERLELSRNGRLESLTGLGVMIVNESDGVNGPSLKDGSIKDLTKVIVLGCISGFLEVVVEGSVEERELLVSEVGEILETRIETVLPEFSDTEGDGTLGFVGSFDASLFAELASFLPDVLDEVVQEIARHVLDRVETESGNREVAHDPGTPVEEIFLDIRVSMVDI